MTRKSDTRNIEECPACGTSVATVLTDKRHLRKQCRNPECTWIGDAYVPTKRAIKATKTIYYWSGWTYELFDKYGQPVISSHVFPTKMAATTEARTAIKKYSNDPDYGKCRAVVWPPMTNVKGTLVR